MWSTDGHEENLRPGEPMGRLEARIGMEGGHKTLSVFIHVEPFENGARPVVEIRLREDRPHEVAFRVFASPGGVPMRSCILTATMGNYARLRRLYLRNGVEEAQRVYHPFRPVFAGFAAHRQWPIDTNAGARGTGVGRGDAGRA